MLLCSLLERLAWDRSLKLTLTYSHNLLFVLFLFRGFAFVQFKEAKDANAVGALVRASARASSNPFMLKFLDKQWRGLNNGWNVALRACVRISNGLSLLFRNKWKPFAGLPSDIRDQTLCRLFSRVRVPEIKTLLLSTRWPVILWQDITTYIGFL